jgi:hypothetical protein
MANFASISNLDQSLVRKALTGSLFVAPYSSAALTAANLFAGARTVTDGATTTGSATLTSATAAFTADDIGAGVSGTGIPTNTTIIAVNSATSVTMSANATATATAVSVTITRVGLQALPTGYADGGITTDEGVRFARSQESETITGWQQLEPVREDRTSDSETLQVDFLQTSRTTIELYTGADLSAATYVNGALSIRKPALPTDRYFRLLALAVDNVDGAEFYVARHYPRCKVTGWQDQAFAKAGGLQWGMTFSTYVDPVLEYSKDDMIGGPGFKTLAVAMGLPAVA